MENKKFVFSSQTIQGAVLALCAMLKMLLGVEIGKDIAIPLLANLDVLVNVVMVIYSQVLTIAGRFKASKGLYLFK